MRSFALTVSAALFLSTTPLQAASLQVSPVSVEVPAPGSSATLTLRNVGANPLVAQIRVFRWVQVNGEEKLEPTDEVIASPPMTALRPATDHTVRIVRLAKKPLTGAENYRLIVDEVPDKNAERNGTIALVLRYSIPVFFFAPHAQAPRLAWSVERRAGKLFVSATNSGDRHSRIAALKLRDGNGGTLSFGNGLTGYVLGRSTMRWAAPNNNAVLRTDGTIAIEAQSEAGPLHASSTAVPK